MGSLPLRGWSERSFENSREGHGETSRFSEILLNHGNAMPDGSLERPSILYLFTCVGLGYGQFTGRIALPIRSFFLEVSTLLTPRHWAGCLGMEGLSRVEFRASRPNA
ncbi:hypothetical protein PIB30_101799 [Stylosanthes scabra]|uniref:Uncharacterized protein n=1 Tax=Stylosanthes scabra TaxID=79078 RepID=A0ABU6XZX0_9FABA|nr:hypothetical protein [Stylosanthes scabra]